MCPIKGLRGVVGELGLGHVHETHFIREYSKRHERYQPGCPHQILEGGDRQAGVGGRVLRWRAV